MNENWKAVPGHVERYEVSDLGRVRSLDRTVFDTGKAGSCRARLLKGRVLRPGRSSNGYWTVALSSDGRVTSHLVADLVLAAFVGPKPPGHYSRHRDDNPDRNVLENLLYGTPSQNARDATTNGSRMFSRDEAAQIVAMDRAGVPKVEIASQFGCSRRHVSYIANGVHYAR